jgi:hypothetical protein
MTIIMVAAVWFCLQGGKRAMKPELDAATSIKKGGTTLGLVAATRVKQTATTQGLVAVVGR